MSGSSIIVPNIPAKKQSSTKNIHRTGPGAISPFREGKQSTSSTTAIDIGGRRSFFKFTVTAQAEIKVATMLNPSKLNTQSPGIHLAQAAPVATVLARHNRRVADAEIFFDMNTSAAAAH